MGLKSGMDSSLEAFRAAPGAVLVDVRTSEEYAQGHIPGSVNIPLQNIIRVEQLVVDKEAPMFVYCHSGARSRRATGFLQKIGYENVRNIGGIASYSGKLEK